jgi:hypothetical protein
MVIVRRSGLVNSSPPRGAWEKCCIRGEARRRSLCLFEENDCLSRLKSSPTAVAKSIFYFSDGSADQDCFDKTVSCCRRILPLQSQRHPTFNNIMAQKVHLDDPVPVLDTLTDGSILTRINLLVGM